MKEVLLVLLVLFYLNTHLKWVKISKERLPELRRGIISSLCRS